MDVMGEHLSESDWELIRQFAKTPAHERTPEILVGEGKPAEEGADGRVRPHRSE